MSYAAVAPRLFMLESIEQPRAPARERYVHMNVRLPEQLHAQLLLLKDTVPNTSMQKIILAETADGVRRLMNKYGVTMPSE